MFGKIDIDTQLRKIRKEQRKEEDQLLAKAQQILRDDLFSEEKVLKNLKQYNQLIDVVNEDEAEADRIFTTSEIKELATKYRLKFLESRFYKEDFPYEAIIRIKEINSSQGKDLKLFRVLATPELFLGKNPKSQCSLFAKTNYDNYYLLHRWGNEKISEKRKWLYWPLRSFETLMFSIILFTLCLTLSLPTDLITLDNQAEYWSGYRGAAFFHLLIFDTAVTVYFAFAFSLNFSNTVWNRYRNFD